MTVHFICLRLSLAATSCKVQVNRLKVSWACYMFHEHCTQDTYWNYAVENSNICRKIFSEMIFGHSGEAAACGRVPESLSELVFRLNQGLWRRLSLLLKRNGRVTPEERLLAAWVTMPFSTQHTHRRCDRNMQKAHMTPWQLSSWALLCVCVCVCVLIQCVF